MKIPRILWGALFAASFLYFGLLFVLPLENTGDPSLLPVLAVVAAATLGASFVLPGRIYAQALAREKFDVVEQADPDAMPMYRAEAKRRVFANPKQVTTRVFATWQTGFILGCAMTEAVARLRHQVPDRGQDPRPSRANLPRSPGAGRVSSGHVRKASRRNPGEGGASVPSHHAVPDAQP
jgi:hypothetical protein